MDYYMQALFSNTVGVSINSGFLIYCIFALLYLIKYSKDTLYRKVIVLAFIFYFGKVIDLTLFPIPLNQQEILNAKMNLSTHNQAIEYFNLVPFKFVTDLKSLREPLLNIIMLLPFGVLIPLIFPKIKPTTLILTVILTSTLIEIFELLLTIYFGIVWWHFDITDIITNSLGGVLGYCFYLTIFRRMVPKLESLFGNLEKWVSPRISAILLFTVTIVMMACVNVSASETMTYKLTMRNFTSSGMSNGKQFNLPDGSISMSGTFYGQRYIDPISSDTTPTIELKQRIFFLDYSFGKFPTCLIELKDSEEVGSPCTFDLSWDSVKKGSNYYFMTESDTAIFKKIGEGTVSIHEK